MTATGTALKMRLIADWLPQVVLVDEAREVSEADMLASLQLPSADDAVLRDCGGALATRMMLRMRVGDEGEFTQARASEQLGVPLHVTRVEPRAALRHQAGHDNQWAT